MKCTTIKMVMEKWHHLLFPGDLRRISKNVKLWAKKWKMAMGVPEEENLYCIGAIDGTARHIARPSGRHAAQESVFDGHHRFHAIQYQAVVTPDGIITSLFGGVPGRHNDRFMVNQSHIKEILRDWAWDEEGNQYFLYADGGYSPSEFILCPSLLATDFMRKMNKLWSQHRVSVEWMFGKIVNLFKLLDNEKAHKVYRSEVGLWYLFCVLLCNCHTCLYGSQTSTHFKCPPPELEEYLTERDPHFEEWMDRYRPDPQFLRLFGDEHWSRYNPDARADFDSTRTMERRQI